MRGADVEVQLEAGGSATGRRSVLALEAWQAAARRHEERLGPLLAAHRERRRLGVADPVADFLFEYYSLPPGRLLRWSPGIGVTLVGVEAEELLGCKGFARCGEGVEVAAEHFPPARLGFLSWLRGLLRQIDGRPLQLNCAGAHEWAMVYRAEKRRHPQVPLRVCAPAIGRFLESRPVLCTHFDAFRFFTPAARPLSVVQPTRERVAELEQPGCLHVNMDVYRWAGKLWPWVPSSLVGDAFLLAWRIREVDMRASPYDLTGQGLEPIPVETEAGRQRYRELQLVFAAEGRELRRRLLPVVEELLRVGLRGSGGGTGAASSPGGVG